MHIRSATVADQATIKQIIHTARLNPFSLDWRRFLVAEDAGQIVGIGQIKPHSDGSRELASIAVIPERQKQGIASALIRELIGRDAGRGDLYLICRAELEAFYARFGFRALAFNEMPPYFRRLVRVMRIVTPIAGHHGRVMKREMP